MNKKKCAEIIHDMQSSFSQSSLYSFIELKKHTPERKRELLWMEIDRRRCLSGCVQSMQCSLFVRKCHVWNCVFIYLLYII